jgi:hypothetical protein
LLLVTLNVVLCPAQIVEEEAEADIAGGVLILAATAARALSQPVEILQLYK